MAAGVEASKKDLRQGGALILRGVGHVQDRGDVGLRPIDGDGEAGDKNDSRLGIDGIHLLHQLLLGKTYALTIASFASVAGHGARESYSAAVGGAEPVMRHIRAACGVVTDHHNRYIGSTRRVDSSVSNLIGRVVDLDAWARFIL